MIQDFKNMRKAAPVKPKAYVSNASHSSMTELDRTSPERLTHDKIVKNFEHFASRDKFKAMPEWLQNIFYSGGGKIISHALEEETMSDNATKS